MFGRLLLLFLAVPLLDAALLVTIGGRIGFGPTVALVIASALVGSWLARREGLAAWRRVQERLASGAMPGPELVDGIIVLVSATLLIAPGFVTDAVGLLGLFPPTRALARGVLTRRFERGPSGGSSGGTVRMTAFSTRFSGSQGGGASFESRSFESTSSAGAPFPGMPFGGLPFGVPAADGPGIEDAEVIDDGRRATDGGPAAPTFGGPAAPEPGGPAAPTSGRSPLR